MSKIIFLDTETTGIPLWQEPSGGENQPHIVQLAALLVDEDSRKIIQSMDVIVKPIDWEIPEDTVEVHGITQELALEVGLPEPLVIDMFMALYEGRKRVAFNTTFDNRIIRIGIKRYFSEETADAWKAGDYECAMIMSKPLVGMKKYPKLTEAYQHFFGKELEDAHSAMADTKACMDIYFAIKDLEKQVAIA